MEEAFLVLGAREGLCEVSEAREIGSLKLGADA